MKTEKITLYLRARTRKDIILALFLFVILILPIVVPSPYLLHTLGLTFIWAIGACSINISGGYAGQLNLGLSAFFGLSAYASTLLFRWFDLSPWIGLIMGSSLALAVGTLVGIPMLRLRSHYFALGTLVLPIIFFPIFSYYEPITGGSVGISLPYKENFFLFFQSASKVPYYYTYLAFLLLISYLTKRFEKTKTMRYFMAIREDEDAAEASGVNTFKYKLIATSISSFIAGMAGVFFVQFIYFIDPYSAFHLYPLITMVTIAMVGGMGTFLGPIVGALVLVPSFEALQFFLGAEYPAVVLIFQGVILMITIVFMPKGIVEKAKVIRIWKSRS